MARRSPKLRAASAKPRRGAGAPPVAPEAPNLLPSARALATLFIAALIIRVAVIFELRGTPVFAVLMGDARQYDTWAQQIASGQWMGTEVFYQTPLYPYALAILYKIAGHHVLLVRLAQALLGAVSCVLLGIAGTRFFDRRTGLIAGWLLAVYAPAIFFDATIQKSSLDLFLMTTMLAALGGFVYRQRWQSIAGAGVAMALFMINRENARVLYPVVALWLLAGPWAAPLRTRLSWLAVFSCAAGL